MINNVTVVGHAHPRMRTAERQLRLLNTNSRFNYEAIAELSATRLADLAPDALDTVFLVNCGSEAVDLAIRLAWAPPAARHGCDERGLPRMDLRIRCGLDLHRRQPQRRGSPTELGAHRPGAEPLSGRAPRRRGQPLRDRSGGVHRSSWPVRTSSGRLHGRALLRQRRRDGAARRIPRRRCTPPPAPLAALPSPTRSRSATAGSVTGSGASSSKRVVPDIIDRGEGGGERHPLGAVITRPRHGGHVPRRRATSSPPPGAARSLSRRSCRARHPPGRGPAGKRRGRRRTPQGASRELAQRAPDHRRGPRATASTSAWSSSATGPPSSRRRGDGRHLRTDARAGCRDPTDV